MLRVYDFYFFSIITCLCIMYFCLHINLCTVCTATNHIPATYSGGSRISRRGGVDLVGGRGPPEGGYIL